ncbi:MAG TPA: peptide chain release factor 2 [Nocardioidaceae bacterium]|nr:peptide chain release factor 2 [Nocardioidaceae bacterium]
MDIDAQLKELDATLSTIEGVLDLDGMRAEIATLQEEVAAPDLWDDQANAQRVTGRLSALQGELERVTGLRSRLDDLGVLFELAGEEGDADSLAEAQVELRRLHEAIESLEVRTLLSGEYDQRDALVSLRSGAGGVDAADFTEMLMRMYLRWAERHKFPTEVYDTSYAEEAGIKSATFAVKAPYAYGTLSVESGTHRLVRISPFDNQGRRQTSFAAVEVVPVLDQTDEIEVPEEEIRVDVYRSSGPGGQSVNTTDSAVRITHLPSGLVVEIQDEKSQHKNKAKAMSVLRSRLLDLELQKQRDADSAARRSMVGAGDRSDKVRTYNFPQDRVTDHRIGKTVHNLPGVMAGDLDDLIDVLVMADQAERLASVTGGDDDDRG